MLEMLRPITSNLLSPGLKSINLCSVAGFRSVKVPNDASKSDEFWLSNNKKMYPVQAPDEKRRPAFVCHQRENIRGSTKNLWYVAALVRGLTVDEAIKQCRFAAHWGAIDIRETIEEARDLAIKDHNVEYGSNLWVAESMVMRGACMKGLRRHARGKMTIIRYKYSHYYVRLEEGAPPEFYYFKERKETPTERIGKWIEEKRRRDVPSAN